MQESKTTLCTKCGQADGEVSCDHFNYCYDCANDSLDFHYGYCMYCILDGKSWEEEWGDWNEVAQRIMRIFDKGTRDFQHMTQMYDWKNKEIKYCDPGYGPKPSECSHQNEQDHLSPGDVRNIKGFRYIYQKGFEKGV